jgi:hypothetical protein
MTRKDKALGDERMALYSRRQKFWCSFRPDAGLDFVWVAKIPALKRWAIVIPVVAQTATLRWLTNRTPPANLSG